MTHVDPELVDAIEHGIEGGFIRSTEHPSGHLRILNYTQHAQYSGTWNAATRMCRGLIVDDDWRIVARPFPKFFNWGELDGPEQERLIGMPPIRIADKLDGSLGILYEDPDDGMPAVATRGSFRSDQANWATAWLRRHMPDFAWPADWTPLVEIIYPANRIVVSYDYEGLVYLDTMDRRTGHPVTMTLNPPRDLDSLAFVWEVNYGGRVAPTFPPSRISDILAGEGPLVDDGAAEGYVLTWPDGTRAKVKLAEYVRLHRIVTGVNARHIWELLSVSGPESLSAILDRVPDEFYDWVQDWVDRLETAYMTTLERIEADFAAIGETPDRKTFAAAATVTAHPAAMFMLYDGRRDRVFEYVWKQIKPEAETPFRQDDP